MQPCFRSRRFRYPPTAVLPLPSRPTAGGIPTLCPSLEYFVSPSACGPPCSGIRSILYRCGESSPTSTTHTAWSTRPLTSRSGLRSGHLHTPCSAPSSSVPTSDVIYAGFWPPMSSRSQPHRELSLDTWRRWLGRGGSHRLWYPPHPPPLRPTITGDATSYLFPVIRKLLWSAGRLGTCVTQICHTGCTWFMVGSFPLRSLSCTTRGGAKSEPIGWTNYRPLPGIPPPGTGAIPDVLGKRHWSHNRCFGK